MRRVEVFSVAAALALASACTGSGTNNVDDNNRTLNCGRLSAPNDEGTVCVALSVADVKVEEITFDSGEIGGKIPLGGVMGIPAFAPDAGAPAKLPAVILVGDQGASNRDGATSGEIDGPYTQPVPVLADLADALNTRGYITLRYDQRTCATCNHPEEAVAGATWEGLQADLAAAAAFLAARPDVDARDIILVGHGQGGTLALSSHATIKPSTIALVASPFQPADKALISATERHINQGSLQGKDLEEAKKRLAEIESSMLAVRDGSFPDEFPVLESHSAAFWRGWLQASGATPQQLQAYNGPVFYMRGEADMNVGAEEQGLFEQAFQGRSNSQTTPALPGLSHALHKRGGDPAVADEASRTLAVWLSREGGLQ